MDAELQRNETKLERLDRNLVELISELRVAQTGVQILFAFLLILPFSAKFHVTGFQRGVYVAILALTGASAGFLIAPSAYHRVLFRRADKKYLVFASNRLMLLGLTCLALAMSGVFLLIGDVLFGTPAAIAMTAVAAVFFATLWGVLPMLRRRKLNGRAA
jgi:Family of unknown function (DUF6328)